MKLLGFIYCDMAGFMFCKLNVALNVCFVSSFISLLQLMLLHLLFSTVQVMCFVLLLLVLGMYLSPGLSPLLLMTLILLLWYPGHMILDHPSLLVQLQWLTYLKTQQETKQSVPLMWLYKKVSIDIVFILVLTYNQYSLMTHIIMTIPVQFNDSHHHDHTSTV